MIDKIQALCGCTLEEGTHSLKHHDTIEALHLIQETLHKLKIFYKENEGKYECYQDWKPILKMIVKLEEFWENREEGTHKEEPVITATMCGEHTKFAYTEVKNLKELHHIFGKSNIEAFLSSTHPE